MATGKTILRFFTDLGFTLRNPRWSWGSRDGEIILLKNWEDRFSGKDWTVQALDTPEILRQLESFGLDERIVHLEALWNGGSAGYTVIATATDINAIPRKTRDFRDDAIFAIERLEGQPDGSIRAVLSKEMVPVQQLRLHAKTHRTLAGNGPFPLADEFKGGLSLANYQKKVAALRLWLIEVARRNSRVTYSEVMQRFDLNYFSLVSAMGRIGKACRESGEPILTALIVDKETFRCSKGLSAEFGIVDDQTERERCYAFWKLTADSPTPHDSLPENLVDPEAELEVRAARFAQVEIRTQQAGFRNAVFRACEGRCVISGCAVPEALEAAHLHGRNWKEGHNSASDGVLLRRDIHALYDRGLLRVNEMGVVELQADMEEHYGFLKGIVVSYQRLIL